ncbi:MAG: hypothetical protein M3R00_02845 [Pseudomonadota bacterium]|nr:hypothetical protein [Pseudomonadota bacterium]
MLDIDAILLATKTGQVNIEQLILQPNAKIFGITVSKSSDLPAKLKGATQHFIEVLSVAVTLTMEK